MSPQAIFIGFFVGVCLFMIFFSFIMVLYLQTNDVPSWMVKISDLKRDIMRPKNIEIHIQGVKVSRSFLIEIFPE